MWCWIDSVPQAAPLSTVRAIYDYDAAASGELTIIDGQSLSVHEKEDEWILVERDGAKGKKECGYVPANYVEEVSGIIIILCTSADDIFFIVGKYRGSFYSCSERYYYCRSRLC